MLAGLILLSTVLSCFPEASEPPLCLSGFRQSIDGVLTSEYYTGQTCQHNTETCNMVTFYGMVAGKPSMNEYASCGTLIQQNASCSSVENDEIGPNYSSCSHSSCVTLGCNKFQLAASCSDAVLLDDIQILPNCSLRQALSFVETCLKPLLSGYPYADINTCVNGLESSLVCGINAVKFCVPGICPTALDTLPFDLRAIYKVGIAIVGGYTSLNALYSGVLTLDSAKAELTRALCLDSDSFFIHQALDALSSNLTLPEGLCDSQMMNDSLTLIREYFVNMLGAASQYEFAGYLTTIKYKLLTSWSTRCNRTAVATYLANLIPGSYSPLTDTFDKSLRIVTEILQGLSLTNRTESLTPTTSLTSTPIPTPTSTDKTSTSQENVQRTKKLTVTEEIPRTTSGTIPLRTFVGRLVAFHTMFAAVCFI